jgi:tetratricopeptide (TPR) repeat protein
MDTRNKLTGFLSSLLMAMCIVLAGCPPPSALVPITRPAEINLRGINKITIGDITGTGGQEIADLLTSELFKSDKFEVLERANLDKILKEHSINLSGAVDEKTAVEMGKFIGAVTLVLGNVSKYKYDQKMTYYDWKDADKRTHRTYTKTGTARVIATFKVVSLTTGKMLAVKTVEKEDTRKTRANDGEPEDPDKDEAMRTAVNATVSAFIKMIAPYKDYITVKFAPLDKSLPELEKGITFAKTGRWSDALKEFKAATEKNPTHDGAWYNLGLAYEYSYMFKEAEDAFNEANKIKPCEKCLSEINNVKRLAAERKKLEDQGVLEPGGK